MTTEALERDVAGRLRDGQRVDPRILRLDDGGPVGAGREHAPVEISRKRRTAAEA